MCGNPFKAVSRAVRWVSKKVKNTYKDVSGITKMEREAKKKQAEMERIAKQKQAELDKIAAQMEQKAADQKIQMDKLAADQAAAGDAQRARVAVLQQDQQNANIAAEQLQIEAAGQSLRVLAEQGTSKAPTATKTRKRRSGGARQTSATQDLRVGSSASGGGAGPNLGI